MVVDDFQTNESGVLVPHVQEFLRQLREVNPEQICCELCGTGEFHDLVAVHIEQIRKIDVHEQIMDEDLACF